MSATIRTRTGLSPPAASVSARPPGGAVREGHVRMLKPERVFDLSRRFAILSLLVIAFVSVTTSVVLSQFLVKTLLQRDAEVSMQFVDRYFKQQQSSGGYFTGSSAAAIDRLLVERYFSGLSAMPDVLRAQVYDVKGAVLWSSHKAAIHHVFGSNPELDRAIAGELVVEAAIIQQRQYIKPEHVFSAVSENQFVEYYIPIWDETYGAVIGVLELYKRPNALFGAIRSGLQLIWLCSLGGGMLMYAVLFFLVRRGQRIIRQQQVRIGANESFAAVGEVAASVAHNIRNPLAAIRSSAELLSTGGGGGYVDASHDIIDEVDRLETWIRNLLRYAKAGTSKPGRLSINDLLRRLAEDLGGECARRGIVVSMHLDPATPEVLIDGLMLEQIVLTLLGNALDAMPSGGGLGLSSSTSTVPGRIQISVSDTGMGIPVEQLKRTFLAPRSTKKHGLGIGLPLVSRTLERMGGDISVRSAAGSGTEVSITFPIISAGERL